ncbi:hypothetical protein OG592_27190 [Streptomyces avidinii]|uniref:hypothetical protein n=1 Tax=Streptomyces avidinii TaxID=1895 RepID=UPI003869DA4D|nr:hypothetical protein OG592_27190 [Streptomyces avidinii]
MTTQLELWPQDWEIEPCGHTEPDPDERAHTDLHAAHIIPSEYGRAAGRGTYSRMRRIHTIKIKGELL